MSALTKDEEVVLAFASTVERVRSENKDYLDVWIARLSRANLRQKIAKWRASHDTPPSASDVQKMLACEDPSG